MKKVSKLTLLSVLVIGLILIVGGANSLIAQEEKPVEIGSLVMLTGANETPGTDMYRGEKLAMEEVNEAGGVLGRPLKIIFEDTESVPKAAVEAVHKLIEVDKVKLIIGEYSSGVSMATGEVTNPKGIVQMAVASTSPAIRDIGPYFFDVMGLDDVLAPLLAEGAMEDTGAKRFGAISVNNPFGIGIEVHACKYVEEHGGECVSKVRYERGKKDYRAELQRLFGANPEAVFYTAYGKEATLILKQAYELGLEPPKGWWADYMTMWSKDVIPETAEGVKGWIIGTDAAEAYVKSYKEKYGEEPLTTFGAYGYDAVWLTAMAINFAGTTDPDVVKDVLPKVSARYKGATGDKTMDEDGMQVREQVRFRVFHNGKLVPYKIGG